MTDRFDWFTAMVLIFSWTYKFQCSKAFRDMVNDLDYGIFDIALVSSSLGLLAIAISEYYTTYPLAVSIYTFVCFIYCMMADETDADQQ